MGQRVKNDAIFALVSTVLAVTERLPLAWLVTMGRCLGAVGHLALPGMRARARGNASRALHLDGPASHALVRRTFLRLGEHLGGTVAMLRRPPLPLPFDPGSREVLAEALDEGRGVVFASAHLGPWERVAATLVGAGFPLTVIAREAYDPRLTRIYDRLRGGYGARTVYRGSRGAPAKLLRTLKRREVLGIPMDLASRVPAIDVPFLGIPAKTPVGPARLALRTGAAVVVGTVAPAPHGLVVRATRIATVDLPTFADPEHELSRRINEELSARIRAMPDAWPWMHPRWPTV